MPFFDSAFIVSVLSSSTANAASILTNATIGGLKDVPAFLVGRHLTVMPDGFRISPFKKLTEVRCGI